MVNGLEVHWDWIFAAWNLWTIKDCDFEEEIILVDIRGWEDGGGADVIEKFGL